MWLRVAKARMVHMCVTARCALSTATLCLTITGCMTLGDTSPPPVAEEPPPVPQAQASVPTLAPAPPSPPVAVKARPHKVQREAARETPTVRERSISINPDRLIGMSPSDVQKLMGVPSLVRDDHLSREWVYAATGCNFRVFFYPNLNAASFRALKYGGSDGNGGSLSVSDACVRRILTARANATE